MTTVENIKLLSEYNQPLLAKTIEQLYSETKSKNLEEMLSSRGFITDDELTSGDDNFVSNESVQQMRRMLLDICTNTQYIFGSIKLKIHYLIDGIIYAINSENILSLARSTRSLLEHLSSLDYLIELGNKTLNNATHQQDNKRIEDSISKFISDYKMMFYNTHYFKLDHIAEKNNDKQKKLRIDHFLTSSKKDFPKVKEFYDFLCDFTHPYFGSNILTTANGQTPKTKIISEETRKEYINQLFNILKGLLDYYKIKEERFISILKIYEGYYHSARLNNKEIKEIFMIKGEKKTGDGSSLDNAIYFIRPRNGLEYAKLLLSYCQKNKIDTNNYQRYEAPDGSLYFIYQKAGNPLWVRMPHN